MAKDDGKSTEVAKQGHGMTLAQMVESMSVTASVTTTDPKAVQEEILNRILAAENVEEVFANTGGLTHSEAILNKPIEVLGVRYNKSDMADGLGFYAVVDYVDAETGVKDTVSIGSTNAMAQLFRLDTLEAFPIKVMLTQTSKPTANGYYPQYFQQAS